jgi:hypothetical protein
MSFYDGNLVARAGGLAELTFDEIDFVGGASELGENVLKFAGAGALVGSFVGPEGTAVGVLVGAVVGVVVTVASD